MSDAPLGGARILVVGATGVLAPFVARVLACGHAVVAVTRDRDHLVALGRPSQHLQVVVADAHSSEGIDAITAVGSLDGAALYGPAIDPSLLPVLLRRVNGCAALVVTSSLADPSTGLDLDVAREIVRPRTGDVVVVLGWTGAPGRARWHSPEEISEAVSRALAYGEDSVVGRVRPWDERPRG